MKNWIRATFIFSLMSLFILACEDTSCDILGNVMLGSWTSADLGSGNITFSQDNTFIDDNGLILDAEENGAQLDNKIWAISGDTLLLVSVSDGVNSLERNYEILSYDCDVVTISFTGVTVSLNKKE